MSNARFSGYIIRELKKVINRVITHVWEKACHIVRNPVQGQDGQSFTLLSPPLNLNVLDVWITELDSNQGFGVFHEGTLDYDHDTQVFTIHVSLLLYHDNLVIDLSLIFCKEPFGNQAFQQVFKTAAYASGHPGCFDFVDRFGIPLMSVTIETAATICGWVSFILIQLMILLCSVC